MPDSFDVRALPSEERKRRATDFIAEAIDAGLEVSIVVYDPESHIAGEMHKVMQFLLAKAGTPLQVVPPVTRLGELANDVARALRRKRRVVAS